MQVSHKFIHKMQFYSNRVIKSLLSRSRPIVDSPTVTTEMKLQWDNEATMNLKCYWTDITVVVYLILCNY